MTRPGLIHSLGRFARDRRAVAAIEFVLVAPIMITLMFGGLTTFQYIEGSYRSDESTATIGDLMSRQTEASDDLLDQMALTFARLVPNHVGTPEVRISSLLRQGGEFEQKWVYNSRQGPLSQTPLPLPELPDIADGDSVILTETAVTVRFPFDVSNVSRHGMATFRHTAISRPRFVTVLTKSD